MYREIGIPYTIGKVETPEQVKEFIDKYNGKKNCYISLYTYKDEAKDSAILHTILLDFEPKCNTCHHSLEYFKDKNMWKCMNKNCEDVGLNKIYGYETGLEQCKQDILDDNFVKLHKGYSRYFFTGGHGFHLLPRFQDIHLLKYKNEAMNRVREYIKNKYKLETLCMGTSGGVSQKIRLTNTKHLTTNLYCIELTIDELKLPMKDIIRLSQRPRDMEVYTKYSKWFEKKVYDYDEIVGYERRGYRSLNNFKKDKIRPCIQQMIDNEVHGYDENFMICMELIRVGKTDYQIMMKFKGNEPHFNKSKTMYQIKRARDKGYSAHGCGSIKSKGYCIGRKCEYYDDL